MVKKEKEPTTAACESCEFDDWCQKKYPERNTKLHCSVWKKKGST